MSRHVECQCHRCNGESDPYAQGRREERAAIVAYLERLYPLLGAPDLIQRIERGEHDHE